MRLNNLVIPSVLLFAFVTASAGAQATPTATRELEISVFGGMTATYTGLSGGRNLGITAGADLGFRPFHGWRPFLEGRGTYPIDGGQVDAQKSALGGVRIQHRLTRSLDAYGDMLFGRGEIDYQNGGYPNASHEYLFLTSTSNVLSPGAGVEYHLTDRLTALLDAQFQHWSTPTPAGSIWSKPLTLGVRYRFNFNRHDYPVR